MSGKPLGSTFSAWLLAGVVVVFVVLMSLGWGFMTDMSRNDARTTLDLQLEYFQEVIESGSVLNGELIENGLSGEESEQLTKASIVRSIRAYHIWEDGFGVLAADGTVVAASRPELVGLPFESLASEPARPTLTESLFAPTDGFVGYRIPGLDEDCFIASKTRTEVVNGQEVEYAIMVGLPMSEVYYYLGPFTAWLAAASAVLLAFVYILVMALLNRKVVRNIDTANEVLGKITAGDLEQVVELPEVREFSSLATGINTTVDALKNSIDEVQGRIDRELATAKAIQESALPSTFPPFPEIDAFDLFADMKAAREVGGDFYDFFLIDDDCLGLVMADVSGKGIPAALFMMGAKTEIRACMESGMGLAEAVQTANYQLCQGNDAKMFVTAFAAMLDYRTGRLAYVNAGHNPPLLRRAGVWEWLRERSGVFLGAFPNARYKVCEIDLGAHDLLLLYTDGVTEAWNPDEELYGAERLEAFLREHVDLAPRALVGALERDLGRWADGAEQADDLTMLALEFGAAPLSTDTLKVTACIDELQRVTDFVDAELARRVCPASVQHRVELCLEELFVNVARYAYGEGDGFVWVTYTYLPDPRGIRVEIIDEGVPFNPLDRPDPERHASTADMRIGGLGIFMTKQIADKLAYEYRDNYNVVTFELGW